MTARSGAFPQIGYVSGLAPGGGYLVGVPLLALEVVVRPEHVFLIEQVVTVTHKEPEPPVVTTTSRGPTLQVGQEVVVAFMGGDLNVPAIVSARPAEEGGT